MFDEVRLQKVKNALLCMQRHSWEQGVAAQAFLESGDVELTVLMAKEAVVRQTEDGRLAVLGSNHAVADPAAMGEAMLFAAKSENDDKLMAAAGRMLDYLMKKAPRTKDGILFHIDSQKQIWVDSYYMVPPFLAAIGQFEEALKEIDGYRRILWNSEKKLFSHIWDEGKNDFVRKDFWGVGNGWAAAGMTRVEGLLPDNMLDVKLRLQGYIKDLIDGCLPFMREDGLYHDVIDKPSTFVETNLSQMLSYTIYKGVKAGWLDMAYIRDADKMRAGAYCKVDEYGLVQDVCGAPTFESPGTAPEGQAFFILMEAAAKACQKR
jgi:unsaturated rhamnogalacturonyl hydrolase